MIGLCKTCNKVHELDADARCERVVDDQLVTRAERRMINDPPPGTTGYLERYGRLN